MIKEKILKILGIHKYYSEEVKSKDISKSFRNGLQLLLQDGTVLEYHQNLGYRIITKLDSIKVKSEKEFYDNKKLVIFKYEKIVKIKLPNKEISKMGHNVILTTNGNLYSIDEESEKIKLISKNIRAIEENIVITYNNEILYSKDMSMIAKLINIQKIIKTNHSIGILDEDFKSYELPIKCTFKPKPYVTKNVIDIYVVNNNIYTKFINKEEENLDELH